MLEFIEIVCIAISIAVGITILLITLARCPPKKNSFEYLTKGEVIMGISMSIFWFVISFLFFVKMFFIGVCLIILIILPTFGCLNIITS